MPTFTHGKHTSIQVGDVNQVLFDLSPVANSVSMPRPIETAETSHFGTSAKEYIVGLNDSTVSISGLFDAEIDAKISAVIDALANDEIQSVPVEYGPAGSATGKIKYSCNVIWTSYDVTTGVGDVVNFSLEGQRTGPTTRGTF